MAEMHTVVGADRDHGRSPGHTASVEIGDDLHGGDATRRAASREHDGRFGLVLAIRLVHREQAARRRRTPPTVRRPAERLEHPAVGDHGGDVVADGDRARSDRTAASTGNSAHDVGWCRRRRS